MLDTGGHPISALGSFQCIVMQNFFARRRTEWMKSAVSWEV